MKQTAIFQYYMIFLLMAIYSCDTADIEGESVLGDREQQIERLSNTWVIDQVVFEAIDVTEEFDGFQIEFKNDFTWEATNGGVVFGEQGEWAFVGQDLNTIEISGEIANITISADVNILFMVIIPTEIPLSGRKGGIGGQYDFQFSLME